MKKQLQKALPFVVFAVAIVGLIGLRVYRMGSLSPDGRWPNVDGGMYSQPVEKDGLNYFVPPDELYGNGLGKDGIPALTAPKFVSIAAADDVLADSVSGISLEVNGKYRFYSFQILNWHEAVNDVFGDKNLLVSYSPLCGSAVVYDRTVDGVAREFGDDGLVYNNCPVFYDKSGTTLWNQATGVAIVGETDKALARYPSTVMTWADFKTAHADAEVLSTDTGFTRDYRRHPFAGYDTSVGIYFPLNKTQTDLGNKDLVYDVMVENLHYGFTMKPLLASAEPNIDAGAGDVIHHLVGFVDDNGAIKIYDRTVGEQVLSFERASNIITDKETGSTWNTSGTCTKGTLKGKQLVEVQPTARYFAFAYVSQFPEATIVASDALKPVSAADAGTGSTSRQTGSTETSTPTVEGTINNQ